MHKYIDDIVDQNNVCSKQDCGRLIIIQPIF